MLKGWSQALEMCKKNEENWALYAKSFLDRTRLSLASKAEAYHQLLQPTAEYLGSLLGVEQWAVSFFMHLPPSLFLFFFFLLPVYILNLSTWHNFLFASPVVEYFYWRNNSWRISCFVVYASQQTRSCSSQSCQSWKVPMFLSTISSFRWNHLVFLINQLYILGNSWQVISPVEVAGYIEVVDELLSVQNKSYDKPTILVAKSVKGEEEIPDGTVAVLTPDMPDVLSHVSVRARNSKVLSVFSPSIFIF